MSLNVRCQAPPFIDTRSESAVEPTISLIGAQGKASSIPLSVAVLHLPLIRQDITIW